MKTNLLYIICSLIFGVTLVSCSQDDGNYEYLSDDEVSKIVLTADSTKNTNLYLLYSLDPGQEVEFFLKVDYAYPERLTYKWFYLKSYYNSYQAEQIGNAMVYPPAQTICNDKDLKWTVDLNPGTYLLYCEATDTVNNMKGYWSLGQYLTVAAPGQLRGLYMLTERDGQSDIEVFTEPLMCVVTDNAATCYYKYYSSTTGRVLEGKPRFIRGNHTGQTSKNAYLVATDKNLYRISDLDMMTVNTWDEMFYNKPEVFNPQTAFFANNCDVLINNGKMHVIYANHPNDMKYSEPIAGDYEAYPYLTPVTRTTWRPVANAINAWQVIYDQKNRKFRPYFSGSSQVSNFRTTVDDAYVDANNVPGDIKAIFQMNNNCTGVVTYVDGVPYLYIYSFYNRVDNGNLSGNGARSIIDLSGCEDIQNAKMFYSTGSTGGFYYATPKGVFSFCSVSGKTTSNVVYTCESGEEISCIYHSGSISAGFPTATCIFWIGVWNEGKKDGKLIQYEMDTSNCVPFHMFGEWFNSPDNPVVTTGWGKIASMCFISAE